MCRAYARGRVGYVRCMGRACDCGHDLYVNTYKSRPCACVCVCVCVCVCGMETRRGKGAGPQEISSSAGSVAGAEHHKRLHRPNERWHETLC